MIQLNASREKRQMLIGRIIFIEKCVASKHNNPFELAEGTEFYQLTVESIPDDFDDNLNVNLSMSSSELEALEL
jgi:hypothetical protein